MKKKISSLLLILLLLILCGCSDTNNVNKKNNSKIDSIDEVNSKSGVLKCTRSASVTNGTGSFNYLIKYNDGNILYLESTESVTIDDEESLKEYEDAYKKINSNYVNIKNYYSNVSRSNNTVTNTIIIDYNKVSVDDLVALEGEEDNIYKDGKAKLNLWLSFAKKLGVSCTEE